MCLILFAYKAHPKYKLIVAANRDEFLNRPTVPAHFWEDEPEILAGRDLEKMGTWMGVTKTGRFAALTNYRNPNENTEGKKSRGELVTDFLKHPSSAEAFLKNTAARREDYPGYNLLAGDVNDLYYYSNVGDSLQKVSPGIHGVSNHFLNTEWPKVKQGKAGLASIIEEEHSEMVEQLFALLENADPAPDENLPSTGVSIQWERLLSPMFIKSEKYGTRSSTVILMNDEEIRFEERSFQVENQRQETVKMRLETKRQPSN